MSMSVISMEAEVRSLIQAAIERRGMSLYSAALAAGLPPDRVRAYLNHGQNLRGDNLLRLLQTLDLAVISKAKGAR